MMIFYSDNVRKGNKGGNRKFTVLSKMLVEGAFKDYETIMEATENFRCGKGEILPSE